MYRFEANFLNSSTGHAPDLHSIALCLRHLLGSPCHLAHHFPQGDTAFYLVILVYVLRDVKDPQKSVLIISPCTTKKHEPT